MGAGHLLSRYSSDLVRGVLVILFPLKAATPIVADVGSCACPSFFVHVFAMAVCGRHNFQPVVIWRKSKED